MFLLNHFYAFFSRQRLCCRHKLRKSATQIMKVSDMICVADFNDLCRRNRIWALLSMQAPAPSTACIVLCLHFTVCM